jgi:hypothetical protein
MARTPLCARQLLPVVRGARQLRVFVHRIFRGIAGTRRPHCGGTIFAALLRPRNFRAAKGETMTISSVGGASQNALSQLLAAQQGQAASAVSADATLEDGTDASTSTTATPANNLTGSTTASLDSQTLQALLGLQEDPSDPSAATPSSQPSGQTQGAKPHHHHHHGGGGMPPASTSTSSSNPLTATASDPTATAVSDSEDSTDASLESVLLAA